MDGQQQQTPVGFAIAFTSMIGFTHSILSGSRRCVGVQSEQDALAARDDLKQLQAELQAAVEEYPEDDQIREVVYLSNGTQRHQSVCA